MSFALLVDAIVLIGIVGGGFITLISGLLLIACFPEKLKRTVMCPPHFNEAEVLIFNHFPQTIMRAMIVAASIAIPFYGRRYNKLDSAARTHSPKWFYWLSYLLIYAGLLPVFIGLITANIWFEA